MEFANSSCNTTSAYNIRSCKSMDFSWGSSSSVCNIRSCKSTDFSQNTTGQGPLPVSEVNTINFHYY
jgi:hypothetical protein